MIIDFGEVINGSYIKDGVRLDKLLTRMGLYLHEFHNVKKSELGM